jgi:hypothetical protein
MRILFFITFILNCQSLLAQSDIPKVDYTSIGELDGSYSKIKSFNSLPDGKKPVENVSYADVQGSPFWDKNWNAAVLVLANGTVTKTQKAKLNLYTNEVHFVNLFNAEMACDNKAIKKVIFFKGIDTSKVMAVFESFANPSGTDNIFFRSLNKGKARLLELKKVSVKESEYNPLVGKKEYSFYTKITYSISDHEKIIPLKTLNQSSLFTAIPKASDYSEWLKQNNNKLKNETEITTFLDYYNNQHK